MAPTDPVAGWYQDGNDLTQERFWDGLGWTEQVRSAQYLPPPPPLPPPPAPAPLPPPPSAPAGRPAVNWVSPTRPKTPFVPPGSKSGPPPTSVPTGTSRPLPTPVPIGAIKQATRGRRTQIVMLLALAAYVILGGVVPILVGQFGNEPAANTDPTCCGPTTTTDPAQYSAKGPLVGSATAGPLEIRYRAEPPSYYPFHRVITVYENLTNATLSGKLTLIYTLQDGSRVNAAFIAIEAVGPGETSADISIVDLGQYGDVTPASVRFAYEDTRSVGAPAPQGHLDTTGLKVTPGPGPDERWLRGSVTSTYTIPLRDVSVMLVFFDSQGNVVAGDGQALDVPTGGATSVSARLLVNGPVGDDYRVYTHVAPYSFVGN